MAFATFVAACYSGFRARWGTGSRDESALRQEDNASVLISSGPGLYWNGRDVADEKSVGVDDMSSKGSASGAKTEAKRTLRVGVIGAGVMGSNHARVLAGLPQVGLGRTRA